MPVSTKVHLQIVGIVIGLAVAASGFSLIARQAPVGDVESSRHDQSIRQLDGSVSPEPSRDDVKAREALWARVVPELEQLEDRSWDDVKEAIGSIETFFKERRGGIKPFVSELLSYWGKLQQVRGAVDPAARQRYLQDCFNRHLFTPGDLDKALESAISQVLSKVEARENQLLVEIRADLSDGELGSRPLPPCLLDEAAFRRQYESLLAEVAPELSRDLGVEISKQLLDWTVVSPLLAKIGADLAVRLGISGAVLGSGFASGTVTFGISVVTGILVDRFLTWIFREAGHDPEAKLAAMTDRSIEQIEDIITIGYWMEPDISIYEIFEGADGSPWVGREPSDDAIVGNPDANGGLLNHFADVLDLRARLRAEALYRLIVDGGER